MNSSLYTGVLGLKNHQVRMDVIGNNIANINTYGFKRGRATFADLLSRTYIGAAAPRNGRGGINPLQVGMGMTTNSVTNIMTQGQIEMTGRLTDVAVDGNGWLILEDQTGDTVYTRDGAFGLDREGSLVNASGWYVQGWSNVDVTEDHDFEVDTTRPVDNISFLYGQKMEAAATTEIGLRCNLDVETRSLIADGIDPKEGYATRNDLLVDLYDAVTTTGRTYTPTHLGLREGDWIEIKVDLDTAAGHDLALTPDQTEVFGYVQVTNDTDIGDLESAITNVLSEADVYGTQNLQAVFNQDEGRFEIYNYDTSGHNDEQSVRISIKAVSGSAIRRGFLLRESTYPTVRGTQLYVGTGGVGADVPNGGETVGHLDYQMGQAQLDYGNITGTPLVYGQLIRARLNLTYSAGLGTSLTLNEFSGYTEGNTLRPILGTETLTVNGTVWHSVTAFTGAANEYRMSVGAGSAAYLEFMSAGLAPSTSAAITLQFRTNGTSQILLSAAASAGAAGAYYLNKTNGLLTLNWDNSTPTASLSGATAFTGTIRLTANYTTEDRRLSAPHQIMYNRWADFGQVIEQSNLGGDGKGRTLFNNMFNVATAGYLGSAAVSQIANQTAGGTAPSGMSLRLGSAYTYRTSVDAYDSLGDNHELQLIFTHVGSNYDIDQAKRYENRWYWRAELPYDDVFGFDSMDNINDTSITTRLNGQLQFDSNGLVREDLLNGNDGPIEFDASPIGLNGVSTRAIDTVSIIADFDGDDDITSADDGILREGVTQMASPSTTHVFEQNGWEMGILETFSIDMVGVIEGRYSNNVVKPIAQIALAMFPNEEGLHKEGSNTFSLSANSGLASIQPATVGARGEIVGGSLEMSNVDITTEFTDMIITERGFQANSRIITTSDEMLTEVLNLKR